MYVERVIVVYYSFNLLFMFLVTVAYSCTQHIKTAESASWKEVLDTWAQTKPQTYLED